MQSLTNCSVPVQHQPCNRVPSDAQQSAAGEKYSAECLSLHVHPKMSDDEVAQVMHTVNTFKAN